MPLITCGCLHHVPHVTASLHLNLELSISLIPLDFGAACAAGDGMRWKLLPPPHFLSFRMTYSFSSVATLSTQDAKFHYHITCVPVIPACGRSIAGIDRVNTIVISKVDGTLVICRYLSPLRWDRSGAGHDFWENFVPTIAIPIVAHPVKTP